MSIAGQTGIPVGTEATSAAFMIEAGMTESGITAPGGSGAIATAGLIGARCSVRWREIVCCLDRHVRHCDNSGGERCKGASGWQVRTSSGSSISGEGGPISASRRFSLVLKSDEGWMGGMLRTSSRLRRIIVLCRAQAEHTAR